MFTVRERELKMRKKKYIHVWVYSQFENHCTKVRGPPPPSNKKKAD